MSTDTSWMSTTADFFSKQWAFSASSRSFWLCRVAGETLGSAAGTDLKICFLNCFTRNKAVSHCQWPASRARTPVRAVSSVWEHSHAPGASSWLPFPLKGRLFAENTFPAENSLFLGKLQTQRKCFGMGTECVCWCCMIFGNTFKHSSICLVSTFELHFMANMTLKGILRKHGLRTVFRKTTQSLADRAKLFLQGLFSA